MSSRTDTGGPEPTPVRMEGIFPTLGAAKGHLGLNSEWLLVDKAVEGPDIRTCEANQVEVDRDHAIREHIALHQSEHLHESVGAGGCRGFGSQLRRQPFPIASGIAQWCGRRLRRQPR